MSIVTDSRDDVLSLIGIEDSTHAGTPTLNRILVEINATLQQIFALGPDYWSKDDTGVAIRAPVSLANLTLTEGSTIISGAQLATWMHGCTVQLSGESYQNRILLTGSGTYGLMIAWQGSTTSSGSGTVYHDAINLANTVTSVRGPVILDGEHEMVPLGSKRDIHGLGYEGSTDYGQRTSSSYPAIGSNRSTGTPNGYLIEPGQAYTGITTLRMRLDPLPDAAGTLRWEQRIAPTRVADWDDARTQLAPHGYHESVFLPILRYRFRGSPHFEGDTEALQQDYDTALSILASLSIKQEHKEMFINTGGGW